LARLTPSIDELLEEEIDGVVYVSPKERRCHVCMAGKLELPNAARVASLIDSLLIRGATYKAITRAVAPLMESWPDENRISYWSIRNHQRRHLSVDEIVVREIIERRAKEQRRRILDGSVPLLTSAAVLDIIIQRGLSRILSGYELPKTSDVLRATEMLMKLERDAAAGGDINELLDIIGEVLPTELWEKVMRRLQG
jgi:hypothetical protein